VSFATDEEKSSLSLTMSRFSKDDVKMDDTFFDESGRFDLSQALPNSNDNPVEYVYTHKTTPAEL
jgi:hypothetical protein